MAGAFVVNDRTVINGGKQHFVRGERDLVEADREPLRRTGPLGLDPERRSGHGGRGVEIRKTRGVAEIDVFRPRREEDLRGPFQSAVVILLHRDGPEVRLDEVGESLALVVRAVGPPRAVGAVGLEEARHRAAVIGRVGGEHGSVLAEPGQRRGADRRPSDRSDRRQRQSDEDRHDRDHDQQLNQREGATADFGRAVGRDRPGWKARCRPRCGNRARERAAQEPVPKKDHGRRRAFGPEREVPTEALEPGRTAHEQLPRVRRRETNDEDECRHGDKPACDGREPKPGEQKFRRDHRDCQSAACAVRDHVPRGEGDHERGKPNRLCETCREQGSHPRVSEDGHPEADWFRYLVRGVHESLTPVG